MISFRCFVASLGAGIIISHILFKRNIKKDVQWAIYGLLNQKQEGITYAVDQPNEADTAIETDEGDDVSNENHMASLEWDDEFEVINKSFNGNEMVVDKTEWVKMMIEEAVKVVEK